MRSAQFTRPATWVLVAVAAAAASELGPAPAEAQQEPARVAVLYANPDIRVWQQSFNARLLRGLAALPDPVLITLEFMALDAPPDEQRVMAERLRERHEGTRPDLVIGVTPVAGAFLYEWGDVFAPGAERLYVLPDPATLEAVGREASGRILDSALETAARRTLASIPQLLPGIDSVFIVSGAGTADEAQRTRVQAALDTLNPTFGVRHIVGLGSAELLEAVRGVGPNSAVLVSTYDRSESGEIIRTVDAARLLAEGTDVPVFGLVDTVIGLGVIGGNITSAELYAEGAVELAAGVLAGEPSPVATPPTAYVFDGEALRRFGIRRARLPEGSQIVNDDPSFLRRYWPQLTLGLAVLLAQAALIFWLMLALRRRRQAEHERDRRAVDVANQARLLETVINSMTAASLVLDVDGKVVTGNEAGVESTFGLAVSDLLGREVTELLAPLDEGETAEDLLSSVSLEPAVRRFQRGDGTAFPAEFYGTRITDVRGEETGYFLILRDVSDRLAQEEAGRQAHKMEALGVLAGGIAHDFNNILMAMVGSAELARLDLDDAADTDGHLQQILTAGERAKTLIGQILMFSRRDVGPEMCPVDVTSLLEESKGLLAASLPKTVELTVSAESDLRPVTAHATLLQQAVINLCTNSVHAMDGRGTLTVRAESLDLTTPRNVVGGSVSAGEWVVITVADDGTGIEEKHLPRIFEPFFTTKPPGEGTGMGLASVYGVVDSHGGHLDIATELGEGTTVTMYLPPSRGAASPDSERAGAAPTRGEGETILLVDDEEMVLHATERMLTHLGYAVEAFSDPQAALRAFRADPDRYALVMSDQSMPGLDGIALLNEVGRTRPGMPAILCSGVPEATRQPPDTVHLSVLGKPCRMAQLSACVSGAIEGASSAGDAGGPDRVSHA